MPELKFHVDVFSGMIKGMEPAGTADDPFRVGDWRIESLHCNDQRHFWRDNGFGVVCLCGKYAAAPPDFGDAS